MSMVFLGGTCNGSTWRNELIAKLNVDVSFFNPVVEDWTLEAQAEEILQRERCSVCLYTITPKMTGVYSIAEVVDDSNKRPRKTILCILEEDDGEVFTEHQLKSLKHVAAMVKKNGGQVFSGLPQTAHYLNTMNLPRWLRIRLS